MSLVRRLLRGEGADAASGVVRTPMRHLAPLGSAWQQWNTAWSFLLVVWLTVSAIAISHSGSPDQTAYRPNSDELHPIHEYHCAPGPVSTADLAPVDPSRTFKPSLQDITDLADCWGATRMHIPEALQAAGLMRRTTVAVLDTGLDSTDERFRGRVAGSYVLVEGFQSHDVCGHGTLMAATIVTAAPNAQILSVKVANDHGRCTAHDVAQGIRLAADLGAGVINLSLVVEPSDELQAAVEHAWRKGAVIIAAAGMPTVQPISAAMSDDDYTATDAPCRPSLSPPVFPAAYPDAIAVTGTNMVDELAPVSNRGHWVDVAAPGFRTCTSQSDELAAYRTGTSTAAAHVSGVAAILYGIVVDMNGDGRVNDEVRMALEQTAEAVPIEGTGSGIVNAFAAVEHIDGALR